MKCAFASFVLGWAEIAQAGIKDKLPPEAYRDPIDQQIARTGKGIPGRPSPCAYEEVRNGVETIDSQPTGLCVKMLPQQRFVGLWRHPMEGSSFCPAPARKCPDSAPGDSIWLENGPGSGGHGELYKVDFIDRRTMYKGGYGFSDYVIITDEVIRMELVEDSFSKTARAALKK